MVFETDGRVWVVETAIMLRSGKQANFYINFSLLEMAESYSASMSLLPMYSVSHPVEIK